uniref:Bestrophin homolog n=1 Tax=Panagrolaimus sp. JU765 TaxID=591449 RepID=A0AC34QTB2_9BILA
MVLTQALVLRDISLQVRKRFPTLDTLVAAGLLNREEEAILDKTTDAYSRYWIPIEWCYQNLYDARQLGKIQSDFLLEKITSEIQTFRHGLSTLLKYDWVPVPLVYPQVIFLAVRIYFFICLFSRQFLRDSEHRDLWLPIATMIQFIVYMGWLKVAEALLNPLGEDDDDLECNYVIDKNLITGLTLAEVGSEAIPRLVKDEFWGKDHIAPLYSLEAAERSVHPLIGSASNVNLVKRVNSITMTPHKNKLVKMSEEEIRKHTKIVDVKDHNDRHSTMKKAQKAEDPDKTLSKLRKRPHEPISTINNNHTQPRQNHDIEADLGPERFDRISPRILSVQDQNRYQSYSPRNGERHLRQY